MKILRCLIAYDSVSDVKVNRPLHPLGTCLARKNIKVRPKSTFRLRRDVNWHKCELLTPYKGINLAGRRVNLQYFFGKGENKFLLLLSQFESYVIITNTRHCLILFSLLPIQRIAERRRCIRGPSFSYLVPGDAVMPVLGYSSASMRLKKKRKFCPRISGILKLGTPSHFC